MTSDVDPQIARELFFRAVVILAAYAFGMCAYVLEFKGIGIVMVGFGTVLAAATMIRLIGLRCSCSMKDR